VKKFFGLVTLRALGVVMFAWLFFEGVRLWYMDRGALETFKKLGEFFLGPWSAVFAVGALGSAGKKVADKFTGKPESTTGPPG
jgi:hypothetical protein